MTSCLKTQKKLHRWKIWFWPRFFFDRKSSIFAEKKFRSPIFFEKKDQGPGFSKKIQETRNWIILFFCNWGLKWNKKPLILLLSWSFSSKDLKSNFFLLRYIYFMRTRLIWLLNISLMNISKSKMIQVNINGDVVRRKMLGFEPTTFWLWSSGTFLTNYDR